MIKLFIYFLMIVSFSTAASPPAKMMEITQENIGRLGFKLAVEEIGKESYVRLEIPNKIDDHWVPVTTQSFTYKGEEYGALTKIELGNPSDKVSVNIYYKPEIEDLMVGVYYICSLDRSPCKGDWDSRLYTIPSIKKYLITKQSTGLR